MHSIEKDRGAILAAFQNMYYYYQTTDIMILLQHAEGGKYKQHRRDNKDNSARHQNFSPNYTTYDTQSGDVVHLPELQRPLPLPHEHEYLPPLLLESAGG
jgi:hypothetical protein